jgi:hypothetical protein
VAKNCWLPPTAIEELTGETAIDVRVGVMIAVTVRDAVPLTLPDVAMIVVLPALTAVASPEEFTVATFTAEELQVADAVRSWVLLSLKVPSALNCSVPATATEVVAGVTVIDVSVSPDEDFGEEEPHADEKTIAAAVIIWTERLINLAISRDRSCNELRAVSSRNRVGHCLEDSSRLKTNRPLGSVEKYNLWARSKAHGRPFYRASFRTVAKPGQNEFPGKVPLNRHHGQPGIAHKSAS